MDRSALPANVRWIDCVFKHDGRILSTYAKRARGLLVRHACTCAADAVDDLKTFAAEGYRFDAVQSSDNTFVFTRTAAQFKQATAKAASQGSVSGTQRRKQPAAASKAATKKPKTSATAAAATTARARARAPRGSGGSGGDVRRSARIMSQQRDANPPS